MLAGQQAIEIQKLLMEIGMTFYTNKSVLLFSKSIKHTVQAVLGTSAHVNKFVKLFLGVWKV